MLKQRCREHGITRWPYRKVKKLDTIISALGGTEGDDSKADADRRLATVKRTRESLITDPNSDAHLRVGKLKTIRRRVSQGSQGSGSDDELNNSGSFGSDGLVPSLGTQVSSGNVSRPRPARVSSGGVDGLLEAAASLSDGETPGTPTRSDDQGDGISYRSPRISGLLSAVAQSKEMGAAASDAAQALGALYRPLGAIGAFAPVKPSGASVTSQVPPLTPQPSVSVLESVNHQAAMNAALDPKAYQAALQAFAQGMSTMASAPWGGLVNQQAQPQPPAAQSTLKMNQHALFAWMAAMSAAPPPPIQPPTQQWNAEALQRLLETMRGVAAANASATAPTPNAPESAHQPL